MAEMGLLCSRVHEDGRCNHPVTGERHGVVVPEEMRQPCDECGRTIRRNPAEHPEMKAVCVDHLDDEAWLETQREVRS